MAKGRILKGNTPKLPITSHINTKPITQAKPTVSQNENLWFIIKIRIENTKAQMPQTTPFIGCSGKTCCIPSK